MTIAETMMMMMMMMKVPRNSGTSKLKIEQSEILAPKLDKSTPKVTAQVLGYREEGDFRAKIHKLKKKVSCCWDLPE